MQEKENHFIKNIEIKNFKCFENFKAEGFGRVNLIGGKNNVGKTAFMEAVWINVGSEDIKTFSHVLVNIKFMRENINILLNDSVNNNQEFMEKSNKVDVQSNMNKVYYKIDEENGIKNYIFEFKNKNIKVNVNDFSFELESIENIQFIDNFGLSNSDVVSNYSFIQRKDEENYLNSLLKIFDSTIQVFKIIDEKPQCKVNNKYLEITEFGDGVRHLISIITSLYRAENGYLFIDEIDNGIHYTLLDELWKVILDVSDRLNVQVFATTHSKEGIESFNRVQLKDLEKNKDTYYFEMAKNIKTDEIFMSQIDSNQLEYELSHQGRFRGE